MEIKMVSAVSISLSETNRFLLGYDGARLQETAELHHERESKKIMRKEKVWVVDLIAL
jgi:hypothetical protein